MEKISCLDRNFTEPETDYESEGTMNMPVGNLELREDSYFDMVSFKYMPLFSCLFIP